MRRATRTRYHLTNGISSLELARVAPPPSGFFTVMPGWLSSRYWASTSSVAANASGGRVSENKKTVEKYMSAFSRSDHLQVLSCLTDDVEWEFPGAFHLAGKAAFDKEIENPAFVGR